MTAVNGRNRHLDTLYPLSRLLAPAGDGIDAGAVHETAFGDPPLPAAIRVLPADSPVADRALARWQHAAGLSHPNLLRIHAAGSSLLEDGPVVYLVTERPDESLAGVLSDRALAESDLRDLLQPTLSALAYLHAAGFAHAALTSARVFAVGDTLKLSSDSVTAITAGGVPANDISDLGLLIVEALTRSRPTPGQPYIPSPELLASSALFAEIVSHCLHPDPARRWTVSQIASRLEGNPATPESLPATPPEPLRAEAVSVAETLPLPNSWTTLGLPADAPTADPEEEAGAGWSRNWVYTFLAIAALITLVFFFGRNKSPEPPVAPGPAASRPSASGLPAPVPAASSPSLTPPPVMAARPQVAPPSIAAGANNTPPAARPAPRGLSGWTVVAASYNSRVSAEKRERALARRFPGFSVNLAEPNGGKSRYLIILGQNLSQDVAANLRRRAIASGLPRDTYIKRF